MQERTYHIANTASDLGAKFAEGTGDVIGLWDDSRFWASAGFVVVTGLMMVVSARNRELEAREINAQNNKPKG